MVGNRSGTDEDAIAVKDDVRNVLQSHLADSRKQTASLPFLPLHNTVKFCQKRASSGLLLAGGIYCRRVKALPQFVNAQGTVDVPHQHLRGP